MKVYTDAARDDDIAGLAWSISLDERTIEDNRYMVGDYTSMEAEYYALVDGIRFASYEGRGEIEVYTDCKPLVKKMRVPDGNNEDWYSRRQGCHWLLNKFEDWSLEWTPRTNNESANRLAYEALEEGRLKG